VVRAHDGRVAAGIAAAEPAALEHRDVADAVLLRQVIRSGQAVAAAADDDHVVRRSWLGRAPVRRPVLVAGECVAQERESREALHFVRNPLVAAASMVKSALIATPYASLACSRVTLPCSTSRCTSAGSRS